MYSCIFLIFYLLGIIGTSKDCTTPDSVVRENQSSCIEPSANERYTTNEVSDSQAQKEGTLRNHTRETVADFDIVFEQDPCNPLKILFSAVGNGLTNPYWNFGDGTIVTGTLTPIHVYATPGNYKVQFAAQGFPDTLVKIISVNIITDDEILTPDTTICAGTTKQIRTKPSLSYCWTPTTFLDNPNSPNPITSTPGDITYHLVAEVTGNNLIVNGNFAAGNTGFTSGYNFANPNITEGQFFVGASPKAWNPSLDNCTDHTSGSGNMMLVNGSPLIDVNVWTQTITVSPNTNYAFSTWIQALWPPNPAQLQFSINGKVMGSVITASLPTCNWNQFYTTWNSGSTTSATISIVNKNSMIQGNDFALDDISFAPVFLKHDSVIITVEKPFVKTNSDTLVCSESSVQLNAYGAATYSWLPALGLSDANSDDPLAKPTGTTEYIVTGTGVNGCKAKDTVLIGVIAKPLMTISKDTLACIGVPVQLFATGSTSYEWSPAAGLDNTSIPNPVASPAVNTTYILKTTDINNCSYLDSVAVGIRPIPDFTASKDTAICEGDQISLHAGGGNDYLWSSSGPVNNPDFPDLTVSPVGSTVYSVYISENTCTYDTILNVNVTVNPNPLVAAQKSNDIDCVVTTAKLTASGASTYNWTPSRGLEHPDQQNTLVSIDTTTTFLLTGTNQFGCFSTDTISVVVTKAGNPSFVLPNAFTPNNDGKNDCFGIKRWGNVQIKEFSIFNRWGEKIFTTKDPKQCWDGRYKGQLQETGGYVYIVRSQSFCGNIERKGMLMLIR